MTTPPAPKADTPERLLVDSRQAARMLGISERTLFGLRQAQDVPHIRLGNRVLFSVDELREWVRKKQKAP